MLYNSYTNFDSGRVTVEVKITSTMETSREESKRRLPSYI